MYRARVVKRLLGRFPEALARNRRISRDAGQWIRGLSVVTQPVRSRGHFPRRGGTDRTNRFSSSDRFATSGFRDASTLGTRVHGDPRRRSSSLDERKTPVDRASSFLAIHRHSAPPRGGTLDEGASVARAT